MVDLIDEFRDAAEVFLLCRNQVIVAPMGGIIDINILAVIGVMNIKRIENQDDCLIKVLKMFHKWKDLQDNKREN